VEEARTWLATPAETLSPSMAIFLVLVLPVGVCIGSACEAKSAKHINRAAPSLSPDWSASMPEDLEAPELA
jgi:hypothetical protein